MIDYDHVHFVARKVAKHRSQRISPSRSLDTWEDCWCGTVETG